MIEEFNMDSKDGCGQLNLAHVARNKNIKKKTLKPANTSAHLDMVDMDTVRTLHDNLLF